MPDLRWAQPHQHPPSPPPPAHTYTHTHTHTHPSLAPKSSDTKWASRLKWATNNHKIPNSQIWNVKMTALINWSPVIFSTSHSCTTTSVTWNKNLNLSGLSIESLIQPDVTLKPFGWLPLAVTNVPALNRGVQTGRHFSDFYQTEFINAGSQDLWQQLVQKEAYRYR